MVRGRRVRCTKNDDDVVSASPKRKDSRMENMGSLANGVIAADKVKDGVSNIPLTRSKNGLKSNKKGGHIKKNGFITNYFTVVTPEKNFHLSCDPLICQSETSSITSELSIVEEKTEHFALNCYTGYESFTDIIHSSCDNGKNDIINNLFKKGAESDECDSVVKIEETHEDEVTIINDAVKGENPFDVSNLRFSPRKHASTLQRCVSTTKENVKTPHRIGLSEPFCPSPSHEANPLNLQPQKNRTRRRLNQLLDEVPKQEDVEVKEEFKPPIKLPLTEIMGKEGAFEMTKTINNKTTVSSKRNTKSKNEGNKANGVINEEISHKLTEYFPVRRSVRKTKKEVLEEKQKDLEMAIREEREDGLTVTHFEGKGRGVVASRYFQRGDFVVEYAGELVSLTEAKLREAQYAHDRNTGCYMYYFRHNNQQYCIDATAETGRLGRLVNHSRNGNLVTKSVFIDSQPHLVLLANQDINPGEEITYDYGDRSKESLQHHPWLAL